MTAKPKEKEEIVSELVEAVKLAQSSCPCTIKERISGHRTECYYPIYEQALSSQGKGEVRG